jgi:fumarate hydratase subunit alpha
MKKIHVDDISSTVAQLCMKANFILNPDIKESFEKNLQTEKSPLGKNVLKILLENAQMAQQDNTPMCQDTGMTVVFIEIGQEVHITGGNLKDAINIGVADGYEKGYLRKSVVEDPIYRINTNTNSPAVIHYNIIEGDTLKISVAPKGFGSENMSTLTMLKPSEGLKGVKKFVIDSVFNAGSNPCPPIILGIGIGGTMEKSALLAKQALLRPINQKNSDPRWSEIEEDFLNEVNKLGIGPHGFGGTTTALGVNIEVFPTHIAGLPVAVNIGCHATRHADAYL